MNQEELLNNITLILKKANYSRDKEHPNTWHKPKTETEKEKHITLSWNKLEFFFQYGESKIRPPFYSISTANKLKKQIFIADMQQSRWMKIVKLTNQYKAEHQA